MLDGGHLRGGLPTMIEGGIFARVGECNITVGSSLPQSGLLAGTTPLISVSKTTTGQRIFLSASLVITVMGTNLAHTLELWIDGVQVASNAAPCCAPPSGPSAVSGDVSYSAVLTPGAHTFELRYFIQSTGVGTDSTGSGSLIVEDCP